MPTYNEVKNQIERRYRRLAFFVFHLIAAFTVLGSIWLLAASAGVTTMMFSELWVGLLIFHGFTVWLGNMRDLELERTWEKYGDEPEFYEKPKRLMRDEPDIDTEFEVIDDPDY